MELIEIKSIWKMVNDEIATKDLVDKYTISHTIYQKSSSEISKIKQSLFLKFIIASASVIASIFLVAATIYQPEKYNPLDFVFSPFESAIFFGTLALSISVMVVFNYQAFKKIKAVQCSSSNLKNALEDFIKAIEKAMHFNVFSDAFMTPIVTTWIYYAYAYQDHSFAMDKRGLTLIILPITIGITSYYFQKHLQKLKFGNYVNCLKSYLKALEQE